MKGTFILSAPMISFVPQRVKSFAVAIGWHWRRSPGMPDRPPTFATSLADPPVRYDLVITGGEVLDPSQGLRGAYDVAIHRGKVAAVAPRIPAGQAAQAISAAGRLVVPGLVDLHAHLYPRFNVIGTLPDQLGPLNGSTTMVS